MKMIIFAVIMVSVCRLYAQYDGNISATSAQAVFLGEHPGDLAGHHVAIVPDLNNDGYDELLVTAPLWDISSQSTSHGRVYLFYGRSQGWNGAVSLSAAEARFHGAYALNEAAHDAFGIGDINGDGYQDLAIAIKKTQAPQGGNRLGKVYLYFGQSARLSGEMSLEDADASLVGNAAGAEAAHVKGVGDVDKDGYDDFIVGAGFHPQVGAEAGKVYLFFGKERSLWTKNADMEEACDASYLAESAGDWAGHRVSGLGDVNSDGYADLLIGANHRAIDDDSYVGTVYLILGRERHLWGKDVSLSQADASWVGESNRQNLGWNVARIGDVDGDGLDDLFFSNGSSTYYLIPAKKLRLDRDMPISSVGATVFSHADKVEDGIGHDIAGVGDMNADGFDDFLIGNSLVSDPLLGTAVGKSYLFMGRAEWPASVAMTSAKAIFIGQAANDECGFSVSGFGDVNGDGTADLLFSAVKNDGAGVDAGAAYLFTTPSSFLTILSPNGGEELLAGQVVDILWTTDAAVDEVSLDYSIDNGAHWMSISAGTPDDGAHSWAVPNAPSATCLVKVSDTDGSPWDASNSVFAIVASDRQGDVNGDAVGNSTDALIILSCDVGLNTAPFCPMNCGDVNADGVVNSTDALIILSYDVGLNVPFPVGQSGCSSHVTPCPGCAP